MIGQGPIRLFLNMFALAFLMALSSGCAREQPAGTVSGSISEITYWPAPNPQEIELAETLVLAWNQLHPDIPVRMQPIPVSQSTEEVLLAAIAGGTTPDVCSNIWPGALHAYTQAGGLVGLDQFANLESVENSRATREFLELFRSSDNIFYVLNWKKNLVIQVYNARL